MPSHRRTGSIVRRLSGVTKFTFLFVACFWLIGQAFLNMCRSWSEGSAISTCSGLIDHMCAEYSRNRLSGSMCLELCQNISSDRFHCEHISGDGKKVLFFTREGSKKLALKTKSFTFPELQMGHQQLLKDSMTHESLGATLLFLQRISSFHFKSNDTFNRFMSHLDMDRHNSVAAVASGQSLLQQEEYVIINNLQTTGIVPKLYGTCGNFYAIDYMPSDVTLSTNTFTAGWPWKPIGTWAQRRTTAIALIELAERMDRHGQRFCDVKGSNFGWLEDGKLGLVDADTVFTKRELADTIKNETCSRNSDCSFWDCHGSCNRSTGRCTAEIVNTNFHAICTKIFRHHSSNAFHGMLEQAPAKHEHKLKSLMSTCKHWAMSSRQSRLTLNEIRKLLLHDQILG